MANEEHRTLFERLLNPDARPSRSSRERKDRMVVSILSHLTDLLNSRQGCCLTLPDYGMPDLENRSGFKNELQYELERDLRSTIVNYEPRLKHVGVHMEETDEQQLVPRFSITAELNVRDDYIKDVQFMTVVEPTGKIRIE